MKPSLATLPPLLIAAGLVLLLTWPTLTWVLQAWRESPLDRQGPLIALLALLPFLMWWWQSRHGEQAAPQAQLPSWSLILGIVLALILYLSSHLLSIHLGQTVALLTLVCLLLLFLESPVPTAISASFLLGLALPTVAFMFGKVFGKILPADWTGGLIIGVVFKWPLIIAALAFVAGRIKTSILLVLLSPLIALGCVQLSAQWNASQEIIYWTGNAPWGSAAATVVSVLALILFEFIWPTKSTTTKASG